MDIKIKENKAQTEIQTLIRIYTDDKKCDLNKVLEELHNNHDIKGLTVFRGIAGFGYQHKIHQVSLLDLSSELPLVIELFHPKNEVAKIIEHVHQMIDKAHIIYWDINLSHQS